MLKSITGFHRYICMVVMLSLWPAYLLGFSTGLPFMALKVAVFTVASVTLSMALYLGIPMVILMLTQKT